jgi:sugar lactone lactonase YvrE
MDGTGNIFVLDTFQKTVFKFDNAGTFRDRIGSEGVGVGRFDSAPESVAADGRGRIYAADSDGVEVFEPDGSSRGLIPTNPGIFGSVMSDKNELIVIDRNEYTLLKYALSP